MKFTDGFKEDFEIVPESYRREIKKLDKLIEDLFLMDEERVREQEEGTFPSYKHLFITDRRFRN